MTAHCCFIYPDSGSHFTRNKPCKKPATVSIYHEPFGFEDYTHSCDRHIADMMGDSYEHRVFRLRVA